MGITLLSFIIVLGVLIFFHEFGHFLIARLFGVGVEKFSLGFGPRLIGKKIGRTDYRISAIPLGGYVKMVGEEPDAEVSPQDLSISFTHKHVLKRMGIVAAGPIFNILLAVLIFFGIFWVSGAMILKPSVGEVREGSPAFAAGLKAGDVITAIDGLSVSDWENMTEIIGASNGKTLEIAVRREDTDKVFRVTPELFPSKNLFGEDIQRYIIGISASGDVYTRDLNLFQALVESLKQTYTIVELMVIIIGKLITGDISADTIGGPIMIAKMAGDQAKAGIGNLIFFIALISVNLAIINLVPIPILDGGHLLFFLIELIKGRPVHLKVREVAQQIGLFIILLLVILVFYNDIFRYKDNILRFLKGIF
ncbi:MAG: RIP metalloprotease RseP [Deltaproteobacteria bacterium]|jgi:regulator of sigma E protease|nr:RIP metalloprotease RseP [Deltaproteobacteria bacterium]